MALYLCKMNPDVAGDAKFLAVVGRIVGDDDHGYRFLPNTSAHKASRKRHQSANACIPKWTANCGFLQLLDQKELDVATKTGHK